MAVIDKFLGRQVEIPEDRRYYAKQGLWGRCEDQTIVWGFSQPALVLLGGVKELDWLVPDGQGIDAGEAVAFAITGKILYIDSPISGVVRFNDSLRKNPATITDDPYDQGWLFSIRPQGDIAPIYQTLSSAEQYLDSLRGSEGFKNPEGKKGGVSGICKAVYTGIGGQKI